MARQKNIKTTFMNMVIKDSIRVLKKGPQALEELYNGYKLLIKNQIKNTPENREDSQQLIELLERAYKVFSDAEIADIILNDKITDRRFILKYGERILGDNKRKYDMSDKFEPSLIYLQDNEKQKRKIEYQLAKEEKYAYLDEDGKKIMIQKIGKLLFRHWNGIEDQITKYRITRQIGEGITKTYEVFSNINMALMHDYEYREVVLEELLSKKNIELSKAGGYIGEIETIAKENRELREGNEKTVRGDYYYRTNTNYMLVYYSEAVTAAMLQAMKEKSRDEEEAR